MVQWPPPLGTLVNVSIALYKYIEGRNEESQQESEDLYNN